MPERFDKESEWSLTPDGKQRNPMAFTPFFGGKRICIGKTFAETAVRFTVPLIFYHLDLEFIEEKPKVTYDTAATVEYSLEMKVRIKNAI